MFTWLNNQGVRSSDGFEVQCIDRFAIEYREGNRVLTVTVEPGFIGGKAAVLFDDAAFERWDDSNTVNSQDEQARIRAHFVSALQFQGLETQ